MAIKSIQITNYRAFLNLNDEEHRKYAVDLPNGENLLIYGENGSGKSSFFNALKDFMESAADPQLPFAVHQFYDLARRSNPPTLLLSEPPFIGIKFSEREDVTYFFSQDRNKTSTQDCIFIGRGRGIWGFLSYRELLRLHLHDPKTEMEHFGFFFGPHGLFGPEILLTPQYPQNRVSFSELWASIQHNPDPQAIEDYNINAAALITGMETTINRLLLFFEKEFILEIEYTDGTVEAGKAVDPKINFKVLLFGRPVPAHHGVLNEARLTSLAISVYLAHHLSLPDVPFKFLFLDDIFIGLDTSNRMPLLKILTAEDLGTPFSFRDFQLIITTYDREWFELSKQYLKGNWKKMDLYVDDYSAPVERPYFKDCHTYWEKAETYLASKDYPAAANYLRKALENELVRILPANVRYPGLADADGNEKIIRVPKQHFEISENTEEWFFNLRNGQADPPPHNRYLSLAELISKFISFVNRYQIPYPDIEELKVIKNRLLNPLSHDNITSPVYRAELIRGIALLKDLSNFKSEIIINAIDTGTGQILLYVTEENGEGIAHKYRFAVLANVRYLNFGGTQALTNASCRSLDVTGPDGIPVPMVHEYDSISKVYKSICRHSGSEFSPDFVFLKVVDENGKSITDMINGQN